MGLFDKLSNLIFEEDSNANNENKKQNSTPTKKGSWTDIFFEDISEENQKENSKGKRKKSFLDLFFEEVSEEASDDDIKSTFIVEKEKISVLDDISSQIERRESELINLAEFFKAVNPNDYPDSAPEYEAYLSLIKQLNAIKDLLKTSKNSTINSMSNYQLESNYRKFELDYQAHINAIQSLCYLSEISTLNTEMQKLFSSDFTSRTERKITQTERYIALISQRSNKFDRKYSARLYKEVIEAEYRLTLLKLMNELRNDGNIRNNPFAGFSSQKKKTFETYLSKDLRDSNSKYNAVADNREKYTKYNLVKEEIFDQMDADAEIISEKINQFTIDDFLLDELFDNGDGFETLKRFLKFKLSLNFVDSKTAEADARFIDDSYRKITSGHKGESGKGKKNTNNRDSKNSRKFPSFDDDL